MFTKGLSVLWPRVGKADISRCWHLREASPLTYHIAYIEVNFILDAALLLERNHGIMRQL